MHNTTLPLFDINMMLPASDKLALINKADLLDFVGFGFVETLSFCPYVN